MPVYNRFYISKLLYLYHRLGIEMEIKNLLFTRYLIYTFFQ